MESLVYLHTSRLVKLKTKNNTNYIDVIVESTNFQVSNTKDSLYDIEVKLSMPYTNS
jgi:hypothetical protein